MSRSIFISYRSTDTPFAALLVDRWLTDRFGPGQVFRDSRSIPPGTYFPDWIMWALQRCRALIAVIGPGWHGRNADGRRLIDDPTDYVRREIAVALGRDILVIPLLVDGARLPDAGDLPTDIAGLADRQYLRLRFRSADDDVARLVNQLAALLYGVGLRPRPGPAGRWWSPAGGSVHPVDWPPTRFGNIYY